MAIDAYTHTPELEAAYHEFVATRPAAVRAVASRFRPWLWYRLKTTGQRVRMYSFDEEMSGAVTMKVDVIDPLLGPMWRVFGINPDDLEPWPTP